MSEIDVSTSTSPSKPAPQSAWEREVLEKVLMAAIDEQRRGRRWSMFYKSALLAYLGIALLMFAHPFKDGGTIVDGKSHTAVVDVAGIIMEGTETNADAVIDGLQAAVEDPHTKGIVLRMNSPGGSPVQSAYIYDEVRRIRKEHPDLPIHAVVEDLCASGCYYVAAATDKIFVNPSSVVGSIGVIMNGFGFVETLNKLGVERRVMTAGAHKALLDPFSPANPDERQHVQGVIDNVHQLFIDAVRQGRGERLKENPDLFTGLVWSGAQSIPLGLADAVGTARSVAKDVIGAEELVNFTPQETLMDRLAQRMGASAGTALHSLIGGMALTLN
ncbi:MAG: S49 family peptidase [Methylococcaceae bacterium]|nr:MAG: S49 family peptidase [Methylococcaceae bacterium]